MNQAAHLVNQLRMIGGQGAEVKQTPNEYLERKVAGRCVTPYCTEPAGETVYCEKHRVRHNRLMTKSRERRRALKTAPMSHPEKGGP